MNKIQKIFIGAVMLVSLGSVIEAKAEVRNVMFHIDSSVVGGTILGQNVIVENIFDAVPSYGGIQDWKPYASRILRVNRGTEVTITGVVKYRTV